MISRTSISYKLSRYFFILIFIGAGSSAFSNDPGTKVWTLEDCIATAKANNLQVKRQLIQADGAKTDIWLSKAANLPNLYGWYSHYLNSGKTINVEDYSYINTQYQDGNLGIRTSLSLFQGFQGLNRMRQSNMVYQSAVQQAEAIENQVTSQVVTAYLQILLSREMLKISEDKVKVSEEQLYQTEEFFKSGRVAKSEILIIKAQLAQDQMDLISRQGELDLAYLVMQQLLNIDYSGEFQIEIPDGDPSGIILPAAGQVYDYAKNNQPRIKAAQSSVMASEAALKLARGATMPSLTMNGVLYSRYSELGVNPLDPNGMYPYTDQLNDNRYMRADINLNIPIFMKYSNGNQRMISQAKIAALDSKLLLEQEKKTMREEIQRASSQAFTAQARLDAANQAVASAQEAYDIINEQFEAGLVTAIDLKISSNQLLQATANQLQAKYELILTSKILDIYQGKAVEL